MGQISFHDFIIVPNQAEAHTSVSQNSQCWSVDGEITTDETTQSVRERLAVAHRIRCSMAEGSRRPVASEDSRCFKSEIRV